MRTGTDPASRGLSAGKILLVEDQVVIAMAQSRMLKSHGYEVRTAYSGEGAVDFFLKDNSADLVLMDIDLGTGIDGTEAARRILARWDGPIVFLSSHTSREMVEKVRGITRYGYVIKNSGDFVLLSSIEMALELFRKEQTIRLQRSMQERAEEIARVGHWMAHPERRTITFSESCRTILGIHAESVGFEEYESLVDGDTKGCRSSAFGKLIEHGTPYDVTYRILNADSGTLIPVRSSGRKIGKNYVGVIQDLSSSEQLLFRLREREQRQAVTLRSIGDGVISTDINGRVTELNQTAEKITGWSPAEAFGKPIEEVFRIVNAITRDVVENPVKNVRETGHSVGLANHTVLIGRNGSEYHIADSASPIKDDLGNMLGIVLIFRDVSREYREYEILRENERMFRSMFVESHTPMLLIDPIDGSIREANKSAELFYGWDFDELKRMSIYKINEAESQHVSDNMNYALQGKKEFCFVHKTATGASRPVRVISGPVHLKDKEYLLSLIFQLEEEKKEV